MALTNNYFEQEEEEQGEANVAADMTLRLLQSLALERKLKELYGGQITFDETPPSVRGHCSDEEWRSLMPLPGRQALAASTDLYIVRED